MCEEILKSLSKRNEFIELLEKDISNNTNIYEDNKSILNSLKSTLKDVKELSKYPEHTALIPLCKNLYMPGKIIHTGEYYVTKSAEPNSYSMLQSLDQTIKTLEKEIKEQDIMVGKAEFAVNQLEERMKIFKVDEVETSEEMANMPQEIKSEKGVAMKVGEFYEILEYEET